MIGHILPIESLIELKIHQNQYFISLFQSNCQILNLTLVQDGCVSLYPPIMKLQILTNFDKVLKTLVTHFTQSNHMIVVILHKHQYLTTFFQSNSQILDSGSRALWTCVILLEQPKILIDHVLPIQLFDWAQKSSKPILYPTLSIQWSNFKSKSGTRWTLSLYPPSWNFKYWPISTKFWKLWLLIFHNPTIWLLSYFTNSNISPHPSNPMVSFWIRGQEHYGHVSFYYNTNKFWLVTFS